MTPIFPKDADTYCFDLSAHAGARRAEFVGPFLEQFQQLTKQRELTHVVLDEQHVSLPPYFKNVKVEHCRGLGFQVWASSGPRVGMGA